MLKISSNIHDKYFSCICFTNHWFVFASQVLLSTVLLYSVEYWFRCMDIDGDGVISMYEMEYFYEEQMQKMEALGIERLPFEDCLCQVCKELL